MNVVLLMAVMCTVALVHGYNNRPCQRSNHNNAYNTFVRRHILQHDFDRKSKNEWKRYLERSGLCNRPRQSFILKRYKTTVLQICNGSGRRLYANLCVSVNRIRVYNLRVETSSCEVERIENRSKYVTVACDKIENRCRPVHFESTNRRPDTKAEVCKPRVHHWSDI